MRVIFLRHAQAAGYHPYGDFSRALTARGQKQAKRVGVELAKFDIEHAFVSTATRTRETFAGLGLDLPVSYVSRLYHAHDDDIFQVLNEAYEVEANCALVIGHSPSIHSCCVKLALAAKDNKAAENLTARFPTATYAAFDVAEDIREITSSPAECTMLSYRFG